jgi:hypothetical protein
MIWQQFFQTRYRHFLLGPSKKFMFSDTLIQNSEDIINNNKRNIIIREFLHVLFVISFIKENLFFDYKKVKYKIGI